MKKGISVIVPAYNEENGVGPTLLQVQEILKQAALPFEIIVVDDGSSDATVTRARGLQAKVIQHPINIGYGGALITGISNASYETITIVDADGTYPLESFPELLANYQRGFDMVVGARQGRHYRESLAKSFLRFLFKHLVQFTCGRPVADINSGFRIFSREKALHFKASYSQGFSFTTTITLLFMLNNYVVGYFPIPYHERAGSSKIKLFRDTLGALQIVFTAIAQYNPLKLYLLQLAIAVLGNVVIACTAVVLHSKLGSWWQPTVMAWNSLNVIVALAILSVVLIKPHRGN